MWNCHEICCNLKNNIRLVKLQLQVQYDINQSILLQHTMNAMIDEPPQRAKARPRENYTRSNGNTFGYARSTRMTWKKRIACRKATCKMRVDHSEIIGRSARSRKEFISDLHWVNFSGIFIAINYRDCQALSPDICYLRSRSRKCTISASSSQIAPTMLRLDAIGAVSRISRAVYK